MNETSRLLPLVMVGVVLVLACPGDRAHCQDKPQAGSGASAAISTEQLVAAIQSLSTDGWTRASVADLFSVTATRGMERDVLTFSGCEPDRIVARRRTLSIDLQAVRRVPSTCLDGLSFAGTAMGHSVNAEGCVVPSRFMLFYRSNRVRVTLYVQRRDLDSFMVDGIAFED